MPPPRRNALSGFKYAQEGILHCFRTQPHMRIHFFTLVAVLISGLLLKLDSRDMLALIFAITLVIVAEMVNTAIEKIVDMVTESYSPVAKLAKDVAAGAVLVAAMNAIIAGVLIFFGQKQLRTISDTMAKDLPGDVMQVVVIGIVLLTLVVDRDDMGKIIGRQGNTAKAIRTLLRVVGMKNNARVNLKINEPEGGMKEEDRVSAGATSGKSVDEARKAVP